MAVRVHQLLAIIGGLSTDAETSLARLTHILGTKELFSGMEKKSRLADEPDKDNKGPRRKVTPDQVTRVRYTAVQAMDDAAKLLTGKWDTALTLDTAQGAAKADVVVDGDTVLTGVPVRHLVYLEGELTKLQTLVTALPELDAVQDWTDENAEPGQWRSRVPQEGDKKEKVMFNWHRGNGTDKFQEQVDVTTRDQVVEYNSTVNYSGALPRQRKALLLERLSKLRTAVKMAREEANSATVTPLNEGADIFGWLTAP
ncbi:MAG TPA: hypothetical protein VGG75_13935 [Trebonia sp.]|jgi:hypothetical protein